MTIRNVLLRLVTVGAVAAASLVPVAAQAQTANKGQLVQEMAKTQQAQMAFVKKLADDPAFAKQYDDAMSSGNYDAVETLVAQAAGVAKSSVHAGPRGASGRGVSNPGAGSTLPLHYTSLPGELQKGEATGGGYICFVFIIWWNCWAI